MDKNTDMFKHIICGIIFITFILILCNSSTRKFIVNLSRINSLEVKIEKIKAENETFKKRLDYLKTKPREMEKLVKLNLGFLADTEIEYVFEDGDKKDEENNEIQ